jgi:hypothetical protein
MNMSAKTVMPSIFAKGAEPYKDWVCPISFKLMTDPVIAQDGYSYERTSIETWLTSHSTSPMDRSSIDDKRLYTNIALKTLIQEWKKNNPNYVKEDEQLDRQMNLASLRIKPVAIQPPVDVISIPAWNLLNGLLSRNSSQMIQNRNSSRIAPVNI